MGALGKHGRVEEPLVFVTELVAFFEVVGQTRPECHKMDGGTAVVKKGIAVIDKEAAKKRAFFAFNRAAFGLVMIRTDGKRLLVYTNSGQIKMKEAYAYCINDWGKPEPIAVRQV